MKAWSARISGASWAEAAQIAGYSDGPGALRACRNYFGQLPRPYAEDLRELWRARLEVLWQQALIDSQNQRSGAVRSAVAIAQRAAALDGLDQPTRLEVGGPSVEEFNRVVAEMVAISRGPVPQEADILDSEAVWGEVIEDDDD